MSEGLHGERARSWQHRGNADRNVLIAAPAQRVAARIDAADPGATPALPRALLLLPLLLAAALLLPWLAVVPGLHGDEAWVALRVRELQHAAEQGQGFARLRGSGGLDGMNFYTGALHQYLVWPVIAALGESTLALRLPGVLVTLVALALVGRTADRLLGRPTAVAAGLLLASSPALVTYGRFALEVTALTPVLAAGATAGFAFAAGRRPSLATLAAAGAGGLGLGLAAYSHLVALPLALTVAVVAAGFYGRQLFGRPETGIALVGMVLGFLPRLLVLARAENVGHWLDRSGGPSFVPDLRYLPALLEWGFDGRILYQRFAGARGDAWPYPLVAAAVLLGLRLAAGPGLQPTRAALAAGTALVVGAISTTALAPHLAPRYFVVWLWALPLSLAWLARPLWGDRRIWVRRATLVVVAFVIACNLAYLATAYFQPFLRTGGRLSTFKLGTRLTETSNHFTDTRGLLTALQRAGIRRVYAGFFIAQPLRVLDRERALTIVTWNKGDPPAREEQFGAPATAFIDYAGDGPDVIDRGTVRYYRERGFPEHFRVYVAEVMSP
jgi:4-amino-4-deoxy-L-arabinose transferase-like glycosyltransferase